jgi:hypothetical protein
MGALASACALLASVAANASDAQAPQEHAAPACEGTAPRAGEAYADFARRTSRAQCRKPWTILVYMMADGDLAPDAYWDLYEMEAGYKSGREAAGSTRRADLLVQLAAPGQTDALRLHMFQQQDEIYDDHLGLEDFKARGLSGVRSPVADRVPRVENGAPVPAAQDLERFVDWGVSRYPADHYLVIVWGHGQGWGVAQTGALASRHFGGLAFSADSRTFLDIPGLHQALAQVSRERLGGRPIDVYASDACLMQMVEVATELSDSARFVSGSSQVEDYLGLPYRRMMFEIDTGRFSGERARMGTAGTPLENDEPFLLARMLPRLFRMSLESRGLHGRVERHAIQTVTMSSISSDELRSGLVPALGRLGATLQTYLALKPLRRIPVSGVLAQAPSFMGGSRELGGFLRLLREAVQAGVSSDGPSPEATELLSAIDLSEAALDRTVISYALGTDYAGREDAEFLQGFRALALWLPATRADYASRIGDFSQSIFYRAPGGEWAGWLAALFGG